jgi:uncharacterized lipoprotein YddW (UPF0748 family)
MCITAFALLISAGSGCKSSTTATNAHTAVTKATTDALPAATAIDAQTELRGLFVATAFNLDWPSRPGLETHLSKDEIDAIIARAVDLNCNAIFLQVRAFGDRIYADKANKHPEVLWSLAFNPAQSNPDNTYDPLREWITRAHGSGLELHVWLNPYRIDKPIVLPGTPGDIPLPCIDGQDKFLYLDPTSTQVQAYLAQLVDDFMKEYGGNSKLLRQRQSTMKTSIPKNLATAPPATASTMTTDDDGTDGVVIDHYFPPEGGKDPKTISDRRDWALRQAQDKWKKHVPPIVVPVADGGSVLGLMQSLYAVVNGKYHKPFGISPLHGQSGVIKSWLASQPFKPFADYLAPEIYTMQPATFAARLDDWLTIGSVNDNAQNLVIVPALNTAAVQSPDTAGNLWPPQNIADEIAGSGDDVVGYIHYSYHALRAPIQGGPQGQQNVGEKLKQSLYNAPKLPGQWHKPPRVTPTLTSDPTGIKLAITGMQAQRWVFRVNGTGPWNKLPATNGALIPAAQLNNNSDVEVIAVGSDHHRSLAAKIHWP